MRKVFLEDLPRGGGTGISKNNINWRNSVGYTVKFIYDEIEGAIHIIEYNPPILKVKYKSIVSSIYTLPFIKGQLGEVLGIKTRLHKYDVDCIIKTNTGAIKILEHIRVTRQNKKGYKYKCLECYNVDIISESSLDRNHGCNVCSGKKTLKGYNDLWTIHPHVARLLKNKDSGYEISYGSGKKECFICPDCGNEMYKTITNIIKQGISCSKCGDGVSVPEKTMFNILEQLTINFECQKNFEWSNNKRYDFYFEHNKIKYIIETHGLQHYEGGFERIKSNRHVKSVVDEQENDRVKKDMALNNGIEHYIIIDCRESDIDYIKINILNSQLAQMFDLNRIDWNKAVEYVHSNRVKDVCDSWNADIKDTKEIGSMLKLHQSTVCRYLKKGNSLGWCNYNGKINKNEKKVLCLTTNEVFSSILEASNKHMVESTSICACRRGRLKSAGKHLATGEKLIWMYYENYIKD